MILDFLKKLFSKSGRKNNMDNMNVNNAVSLKAQDITSTINYYKQTEQYKQAVIGDRYYRGNHDILSRQRTGIGENGTSVVVNNLPNNKLIDNQYSKLVKQKVNYILAKPLTLSSENGKYLNELKQYFNKSFMRTLKRVTTDVYNTGLGYLYVYYDNGELKFKRLDSLECIPMWKDKEHTELDYLIRTYTIIDTDNKAIEKIEVYTREGVKLFSKKGNDIKLENEESYITLGDNKFNWEKLPIIAFKANEIEQPLISRVKSLQDSINELISDFQNNMQEDARNTIIVLKNYGGENLGEFRRNLALYGAVKVDSDGGIDTLKIDVNSTNYEAILRLMKKALIENGMGLDSKMENAGANPNQLNIRSMYSDIDLDTNDLETEFQASLEELLWFINVHLKNNNVDVLNEVDIIFNRDILVNESQVISDIKSSVGILSNETLVEQHPYVSDVTKELDRLKQQEKEQMESLYGPNLNNNADINGGVNG